MGKDIVLGEDWLITLSVIYGLGAVLSVWATLLSPMLLDIWDTPQGQKKKTDRDWSTIFLILLLLQPVTFAGSAVGMWWISAFAVVPPAHFVLTFISFLAIDFFRPDDDVFSKYKYSVLMWSMFELTSFLGAFIIASAIITTYICDKDEFLPFLQQRRSLLSSLLHAFYYCSLNRHSHRKCPKKKPFRSNIVWP